MFDHFVFRAGQSLGSRAAIQDKLRQAEELEKTAPPPRRVSELPDITGKKRPSPRKTPPQSPPPEFRNRSLAGGARGRTERGGGARGTRVGTPTATMRTIRR